MSDSKLWVIKEEDMTSNITWKSHVCVVREVEYVYCNYCKQFDEVIEGLNNKTCGSIVELEDVNKRCNRRLVRVFVEVEEK